MKHVKFMMIAVVVAAAAIGSFAFTPSAPAEVKDATQVHWVFLGSTMEEAFDVANYEPNGSAPACQSGTAVPCSILGDEDPEQFQQYLDSFGGNGNSLKAAAEGIRN